MEEGRLFLILLLSSTFRFLLIVFHYAFSISYKILPYYVYYYCIFPPEGGVWVTGVGYLGNSSAASGRSDPRGLLAGGIYLFYYARFYFLFCAGFSFLHTHVFF